VAKTERQVFEGIKAYIDKQGKPYSAWYAGIASDAEARLFVGHNVSRTNDKWAYDQCIDNRGARNVEDALLKLGCDGGSGGGDQSSTYVYSYLKSLGTKP